MLLTSVVVIAIVSSAYAFVPSFAAGVDDLGNDVQQVLQTGTVAGLRAPIDDVDGGVSPSFSKYNFTWWDELLEWWN